MITDADGKTHIVFHGWDAAVVYRSTYVADLTWTGNTPTPSLR